MEHVVNVLPGAFSRPERFRIQMAGITYPDRSYHIVREDSDIYCMEYVIDGKGDVTCDDRRVFPVGGDAYILPPHTAHDYRSSMNQPYKKIWVNMSGLLCDALYREYHLNDSILFAQVPVRPLFQELLELCERNSGSQPQDIERASSLLIHDIFARLAERHIDEQLSSTQNRYAKIIKDMLDRKVEDNITLDNVSREIGISVSQISRIFRHAYGQSAYRYYLMQRMQLARELLNNTGMRIKEIASRLAYADAHYFSTQFRMFTGESPRHYRNQHATD
ncbi:MAG: AraC family transcriptional regulator [Bifidobacterium aquikefiri]|uniref:Transcriptional regulator, AraC family n=1 Tax=Bifidobacterium aquikefiri TaxID=1653207 RepID=A0A261G147_9BIFI|nr:AraC family transcriptional regulator [Bifidobacterium aquikefiri]OZG65152.1 transcriptional regulator, AraC family [Bifidobacterium aquikefiri]